MLLNASAKAQGMAAVAERAGIARESLYRALSPANGNPTVKTLLAILSAAGLKLEIHRINAGPEYQEQFKAPG